MNVYQSIFSKADSECAEYLKLAENYNLDCLNKDKIIAFGEKYNIFPDNVKNRVLEALDEIKKDDGYISLCRAMLYFLENSIPLNPLMPPFEEGIKAEYALFFPVWYMAQESAEDMENRGVPKEVISKTFYDISFCVEYNQILNGRMGTSAHFFWLPCYAQGKLIKINDFLYEKREFKGSPAIGIHIPNGTKLDVHQNLLSFKSALDFFAKYYPELEMSGFVCESWLLSKEIEKILGKKTNISRFGDMFDRFDVGDTKGDAVFRCVYKKEAPYPPIEDLPENTSLQKNLKEYMQKGKKVYEYGGFISKEKLFDMLKEFE